MVTISVAQMRDMKADSELFENAEPSLIMKYDKCMGETSYLVYYLIAAILFTMVLLFSDMIPGDIGIVSLVVTLVSGYWLLKGKYVAWITGNKKEKTTQEKMTHVDSFKKMNCIQIGTVILYGVLFFFAPYLKPSPEDVLFDTIVSLMAIGLILANVISAIAFIAKEKEDRKLFIFCGIRNVLLLPSAFLFSEIHQMGWEYENGVAAYKYDSWYVGYIIPAVAWALGVIVVFKVLERLTRKKWISEKS